MRLPIFARSAERPSGRVSLACFFAATIAGAAQAQPCAIEDAFGSMRSFVTGADHSSLRVADFNGDGVLDILTTARNDGTINLFAGLGGFVFAPPSTQDVGVRMFEVAVADLNNDGLPDLGAVDPDTNNIQIFLNTGDGTFAAPLPYDIGISIPQNLTFGDLNNDGIADLLVVANTADVISAALGLGDGTFSRDLESLLGTSPFSIQTGDFNADGLLDVAVASFDLNVYSFLGTGSAALGTRFIVPWVVPGVLPAISATDTNGDGVLDLVVATSTSLGTLLGLGNGDFDFLPASQITTSNLIGLQMTTSDLNGDGMVDLVAPSGTPNRLAVLPGLGTGVFGEAELFDVGSRPESLQHADLDSDGDPDLVFINRLDGTVGLLENLCNVLPIIDRQPMSVAVDSGQLAELDVQVTDGRPPLAFRWRRDGVELSEGGPFSGVHTPRLTIAASDAVAGTYDVVISNPQGQVVSRLALVAVREECRADFDGDGALTIFDFLAFQNAFAAGCP